MPAPITRKSQGFSKFHFNKPWCGFTVPGCRLTPLGQLFGKSLVQGGRTVLTMWDLLVRQGTDAYHAGKKAVANEARSVMVEKFGEASIPAADYESALKVLRAVQDVVSRYRVVMWFIRR
jgi:hypothetical protein